MLKNKLFTTSKDLKSALSLLRDNRFSIGFVPTMGALHAGHLSLVDKALSQNDWVVISIFINPEQFNSQEDLEKYPRTLDSDLLLLESKKKCIIFHPEIKEIYPITESFVPMDLKGFDDVMEGKFRPGHFKGVVHVVHNFFQIIKVNRAYFGQKDFQQLAIIRKMVAHFNFSTEIVSCETLRESSGLAMSSRNMRLNSSDIEAALIIYKTLLFVKENKSKMNPQSLKAAAIEFFKSGDLQLEYLEIVVEKTLTNAVDWQATNVCCIAAYCNKVRLIDNIIL
jgi:pantoate--beta-alanine ligase